MVQVVQEVIQQRGRVQGVHACLVGRAQTRIHSQVREIDECIKDEVSQKLVIEPTPFQAIKRFKQVKLTKDRTTDTS